MDQRLLEIVNRSRVQGEIPLWEFDRALDMLKAGKPVLAALTMLPDVFGITIDFSTPRRVEVTDLAGDVLGFAEHEDEGVAAILAVANARRRAQEGMVEFLQKITGTFPGVTSGTSRLPIPPP